MKEKRLANAISNLRLTSREVSNRKSLVDWMCDVGDNLEVSAEAIHKAVFYFDRIACDNHLKENELKSIALICILLAAKLTESDSTVNNVASLFRKIIGSYKLSIMQYEAQIMQQLNWDLQHITAMEFIKFFASQGIVFSADVVNSGAPSEKAVKSLRQYAEFFADLCLQESEFIGSDSLVLAAGIIAAARKMLKFKKVWNKELEELVTVKREDAEICAEVILKKYETLFPKSNLKETSRGAYSSLRSSATTQYSIKRYI
eukprot:TRINITY_DN10346_c0_g1_i1.p1 TRINITY_DN10346_c0_g1~~TRINITY_DN10346_c0_g1_i1.p1  ORF type:complete len:260 (+),score=79.21 TRINITY_DN10346_c0_g1_i1:1092-1871(+)